MEDPHKAFESMCKKEMLSHRRWQSTASRLLQLLSASDDSSSGGSTSGLPQGLTQSAGLTTSGSGSQNCGASELVASLTELCQSGSQAAATIASGSTASSPGAADDDHDEPRLYHVKISHSSTQGSQTVSEPQAVWSSEAPESLEWYFRQLGRSSPTAPVPASNNVSASISTSSSLSIPTRRFAGGTPSEDSAAPPSQAESESARSLAAVSLRLDVE